jgi:hypothetical protein
MQRGALMRVRPVFWLILLLSCMGVLLFAGIYQVQAPLHFHITRQYLVSQEPAILELHLTDPQGLPIEQANLVPSARMTNMPMPNTSISAISLGQGLYQVQFEPTMAGLWAITIQANAQGFAPLEQTMQVEVT